MKLAKNSKNVLVRVILDTFVGYNGQCDRDWGNFAEVAQKTLAVLKISSDVLHKSQYSWLFCFQFIKRSELGKIPSTAFYRSNYAGLNKS